MEKYENPEIQMIFLANEDIISTSFNRIPDDDELPEFPI